MLIAKFKGVDDRTAAEKLNGTQLFVERAALDKVAKDEDEFLYADLIGLKVQDETGHDWGHVAAVFEFGAGDILEIKCADGKLRMIPFSKAAVPTVDVAGGMVKIDRGGIGNPRRSADTGRLGMSFRATVLTLYPEMFPGHLGQSMAGRALENGIWSLETVQIRDFATGKAPQCR